MMSGNGTSVGRDQTIYATSAGKVSFAYKKVTKFTGNKKRQTIVSVERIT